MIDPALFAVTTGAGGSIVASMITGGTQAIRARIVELFHRGTSEEQASVEAAFDSDARRLAEWARAAENDTNFTADLSRAAERVSQEWARRFSDYVTAHPEARPRLEALAMAATVSNSGNQHNTGPGAFINGNVAGGVHNSYDWGSH
ncbi:hypothetical protein ACFRMQ_23820 [Kitasatospora sp. NPDC056783]|uniref:hypothetical protein n=1 Tax=Kitasatospora sp. NPDC056783 TaxID=3345943 RepID=UPI003693BE96